MGHARSSATFSQHDAERLREDRALFQRFRDQGDPVDREVLVERFLPLARNLASRYLRYDEPFDDIFQVACLGLVKAIDGFDVERGRAFTSYAVPTIVGEIKRHYRDRTWAVHVPRDLQELTLSVGRAAGELERMLLRKPNVGELAAHLEISHEDVLEALQARRAHSSDSLDAPASSADGDDSARTVGESIGHEEPGYARAEQRATLKRMMTGLAPRDRLVLRLRFEHDLTQEEIGKRVGISQMQVSRVLRRSIARLHVQAKHARDRDQLEPAARTVTVVR
jgi:RNA polymerase sigma-B factor